MRIKFKLARGRAVLDMTRQGGTLEEAVKLLADPNVISITVVKQTPAQYLRKAAKAYFTPLD